MIVVVMVFIVCESPEMIYRILTTTSRYVDDLNDMFTTDIMYKFGIISELCSVVNSTVNFFIYLSFSKRFLMSLKEMFQKERADTDTEENQAMIAMSGNKTSNRIKHKFLQSHSPKTYVTSLGHTEQFEHTQNDKNSVAEHGNGNRLSIN